MAGSVKSDQILSANGFEEDELLELQTVSELCGVRPVKYLLPTGHELILNSVRLHYLDWGGDGPPVLLLHGGAQTAHTYDLVCLALSDRYRCIALDQRGHGDSEWSPVLDYSPATHCRDLTALVDSLGWDRFVLVGMSMGGFNSIMFAAHNSSRLAGLVLIDVGPEMQPLDGARRATFVPEDLDVASIDDLVAIVAKRSRHRDPRVVRRSVRYMVRQDPSGRWHWKWDSRARGIGSSRLGDPKRHASLWAHIDRIACPTLVIRGANSVMFSDENAHSLATRLKYGSWVKVADAGHNVQSNNPAGLVDALVPFLARVTRP
jgi:esterase